MIDTWALLIVDDGRSATTSTPGAEVLLAVVAERVRRRIAVRTPR